MKQMAISFGIGAALGSGFSAAFSKAGQTVMGLNKHLNSLEQQQLSTSEALGKLNKSLDPEKFAQWTEELKKTESEIATTKNQLTQLDSAIKSNNQVLISLNGEYSSAQAQVKNLNSAYKEKEKKHKELKESLETESDAIKNTKARLNELKESMEKTADPTGELRKEQEALKGSLRTLQESYKQNKKAVDSSKESLETEKDILNGAKKAKQDLEKQIKSTTSANKNLTSEQAKLENSLKKTEAAYAKSNAEHKSAQENMGKERKEVEELQKTYQKLTNEIERTKKARDLYAKSEAVKDKAQKLSSVGTKAIVGGGAGLALVSTAANSAIKQQAAFTGIKRMYNFNSKEEEKEFRGQLDNLIIEKKMAVNVEELYNGAASVGQAGITDKAEALKIVELGVKAGVAMDMARDESISNLVAMKKIHDLSYDALEDFADKINYLGNTTGAGAAQLINFTTRLGSIGTEIGLSKEITTAIGATLMDLKIPTEIAATGMKNMATSFTKGQFATEKEKEIFNMLGLTPEIMAKKMKVDGEKAFIDFFERISKVKDESIQTSIMQTFFGKENLVGVTSISSKIGALEKNLVAIKDPKIYKNSINDEYLTGAETLESKIKNLQSSFEISKGRLGESLFPEIESLVGKVNNLMDKIYNFQKANPKTFSTLFKGLAYGSVAMIAFGGAIKGVTTLMTGYSLYLKLAGIATEKGLGIKVVSAIGGMKSALIGMMGTLKAAGAGFMALGPAAWVIAGIAGVAILGYTLYKNWDKVKEIFWKVVDSGKALWNKMPEWAKSVVIFTNPIVALIKACSWLWDNFDRVIEKGKEFGSFLAETFNNSFIGKAINTGVSFFKEGILGFAEGGMVSSPTLAWVGEGGSSESIIPHDGSERSYNLWKKTGDLIGADNKKEIESAADNINFTFAPVINTQNSDGITEILKREKENFFREFEKNYDKLMKEKFRRGNGR